MINQVKSAETSSSSPSEAKAQPELSGRAKELTEVLARANQFSQRASGTNLVQEFSAFQMKDGSVEVVILANVSIAGEQFRGKRFKLEKQNLEMFSAAVKRAENTENSVKGRVENTTPFLRAARGILSGHILEALTRGEPLGIGLPNDADVARQVVGIKLPQAEGSLRMPKAKPLKLPTPNRSKIRQSPDFPDEF